MSEKYNECMEHIQMDADMRERLLRTAREKSQGTRRVTAQRGHRRITSLSVLRYSSVAAACLVLVVIGAIALHRDSSYDMIPSLNMVIGKNISGVGQYSSSYQRKQTEQTTEDINLPASITEEPKHIKVEMQEVGSLGELSDLVGFSVAELDLGEESLPFSPSQVTYTSVNDQVAKVTYSAENATIILSKTEKIIDEDKTKPTNAPMGSPFPDMLESLTVASCTVNRAGTSVTLFGDGPLYSRATWDAGEYAYKLDVPEQAQEEQMLEMVDSINQLETQAEDTSSTECFNPENSEQEDLSTEEVVPTPTNAINETTPTPVSTPTLTQAAVIVVATVTPAESETEEPVKLPTPTQAPELTATPEQEETLEPTAIPIPTVTAVPIPTVTAIPTEEADDSAQDEENPSGEDLNENTETQTNNSEETTEETGGSKINTHQEQTDTTNTNGFNGEDGELSETTTPTPVPSSESGEQSTELPGQTTTEESSQQLDETEENTQISDQENNNIPEENNTLQEEPGTSDLAGQEDSQAPGTAGQEDSQATGTAGQEDSQAPGTAGQEDSQATGTAGQEDTKASGETPESQEQG